jgi:hypothetical protein
LDGGGARFGAAAEDQHATAEDRGARVVKRAREGTGFAQFAIRRVEKEDARSRTAGPIEPTDDQGALLRRDHRLPGDRSRKRGGLVGDKKGSDLRGGAALGAAPSTRTQRNRHCGDDQEEAEHREQQATPSSRP